jgi:cytoskeleton protein RodZ
MPVSDDDENLGSKLRQAREAKDLTIDEVAAELRIGVPFLNALEEGDYQVLGAPVFAKGYLKQYGARLGLDVSELVEAYRQAVGDESVTIAPSRTITLRDEHQITVWVIAAVVLLLIGGVIWFWWWLGTDTAADITPPEPLLDTLVEPLVDTLPGPEITRAPGFVPPAEPVVESTPEPEPLPETVPEPEPEPEPDVEPAVAAAQPTPEVPAAGQGPQLEIRFIEDSWTEITAISGERLFYDLGRAGTTAMIPADRALNIFFGNAAGVELRIDGEPFEIPAAARRRDLAQFVLPAQAD